MNATFSTSVKARTLLGWPPRSSEDGIVATADRVAKVGRGQPDTQHLPFVGVTARK